MVSSPRNSNGKPAEPSIGFGELSRSAEAEIRQWSGYPGAPSDFFQTMLVYENYPSAESENEMIQVTGGCRLDDVWAIQRWLG